MGRGVQSCHRLLDYRVASGVRNTALPEDRGIQSGRGNRLTELPGGLAIQLCQGVEDHRVASGTRRTEVPG